MNQNDRDNLNFLLNASPEVIKDWYSQVDQDDILYAHELLDAYSRELSARTQEAEFEFELSMMREYTEAKSVLAQFRI